MSTFQLIALILVIIWLAIVVFRFRKSTVALIAGLLIIGVYTFVSIALGKITLPELGLGMPNSWWITIGFSLGGLAVILAYSRLADRLASKWFAKPPDLGSFQAIQQSKIKLIVGIVIAWILGGFLEELIARGIVLRSIEVWLQNWFNEPISAGIAVCVAALGAGMMHLYQGPRAVAIITQLSILFGILFVISGYNLWAVIICHGLYDSIAFIRFANKQSRYSNLNKN